MVHDVEELPSNLKVDAIPQPELFEEGYIKKRVYGLSNIQIWVILIQRKVQTLLECGIG